MDRAGRQWSGNLISLKGVLVRMVEYWPHLAGTKGKVCPVTFMDAELDGFSEKEQLWFGLNKFVKHWEEEIRGIAEDSWISHDRHEEAVR